MAQKTMTEKDMYQQAFESEYEITHRVLRAYPADKSELKPSEKMKNARELAWMLVLNQSAITPTLNGTLNPASMPQPPKDWKDILPAFEIAHREAKARLERATDEELNRTMPMPVAKDKIGEVRNADFMWMLVMDTVHHRGQLTVFLRLAGGKLPSIYGPTADEPWGGPPSVH